MERPARLPIVQTVAAGDAGILADEATPFEAWVREIPAGAVVITTGAVSKGPWDFIPASLRRLGAAIHFHRGNIRPGKPVLFATLPNGNLFFGLPVIRFPPPWVFGSLSSPLCALCGAWSRSGRSWRD